MYGCLGGRVGFDRDVGTGDNLQRRPAYQTSPIRKVAGDVRFVLLGLLLHYYDIIDRI